MPQTILIVEDNELNMRMFNDFLQVKGYETITSVDGSDCLEIARNKKPDLIIMDIQLPGRSGLEITKDLKVDVDLKHIPVVAVTAFAMMGNKEKYLESGFDEFVVKPVPISILLEIVERLLLQQSSA